MKIPKFSTEPFDCPKLVCRTNLTGHAGDGIVIVEDGVDIPDAPLYTEYVRSHSEWRVHVAFGKVIDVTRKIRDPEQTPRDWNVRTHANGFIFARNSGECPQAVKDEAVKAVEALALDFAGVDCLWTIYHEPCVLEVNSAPGLEGTTLRAYTDAFQQQWSDMCAATFAINN